MLGYLAAPEPALALPGVTVSRVDVPGGGAMFDLLMQLEDAPGGVSGAFTYSTDLFERQTVARLAASFARLMTAALADPDAPLSRLPAGA
jgi:hypothetical protein